MIEVELDDAILEFPDDTDMETMQRVVDEYLASQAIDKPKEPQPAGFSSEDIGTVDQTFDDPFGVGKESGKAFIGGFGKGLLGAVSGTVELADAATNYVGWEDAITEDGYGKDIIDFANAGKELIDENIGVSEDYQDNWLVKFGGGLGSFASFLVPGGALGLAGKAANGAKVLAGVRAGQIALPIAQGVGLGAQEQVDRIDALRQQGQSIDRDTEDKAVLLGGVVGASEALSPLSILKKIRGFKDEESKKKAFNTLRSAIREGSVEGTQEVTASLLQDAIADNLYDENVQYGESAWDDFSIGFTTAALTDALTGYAFKERKKITRESSLEREAALRDQTEQEVQSIYDRIDNDKAEAEKLAREELARIQREDEEAQAAADLQIKQEQDESLAAEVSKGPALPLDNDSKRRLNSGKASLAEVIPSYARQLSRSVLFPNGGTYEVVEETVEGVPQYKAVHTQTGRQWGEAGTYEYATHLMSNLNRRIIENSINNSVIDSINEADQEYDQPTTEALFRIGRILNNPKSFKITSAELNEAAGTVDSPNSPYNEGASLDALHRAEWNVEPLRQRGIKYYKPLSNLTAAQQINFERAKKGLPPTNEFTYQEAESVLKDNMPKLFDSLVDARIPVIEAATRVESIDADFAEVPARRRIRDVLTEKNIVSDISSPEIQYLFESITGKKSLDDMSASQKRHLFHSIQTLPRLDSPSNIPNFKPKTYGKNQLATSTDFVIETGDGTVENIQTSISESVESESQRKIIAKEIHKDLKDKGVINEDNTVAEVRALPSPQGIAAPEQDPVAEEERVELPPALKKAIEEKLQLSPFLENRLNKFTSNLRDELDALGLKDVGLDLSQELQEVDVDRDGNIIRLGKYSLGTTGFYKPYANTIFLALDRVQGKVRNKNLADMVAGKEVQDSSDAIFDEVRNVLSHEIVHAMRKMDLWTDKEWSSLENLARKKMRKGNISYLRDAEMAYRDKELSKVAIMEEAVANLIRDARSNPGLITGKPRALVNRIKEFFERMGSLLRGTGFQSFGDIVNALESGEIGSRSRYADTKDVADIRTLETTERKLGAVPERGIGTESDVRYDRARLKVMGVMADENQISESLRPPRFHDSPIWGPDFVKLFEELEAKIGGEREVAESLNISYEDYVDYKEARTRIPLDIRQDMLYAVSEPDYPDPEDEVSVARFAKEQKEKRLKALKDIKKKGQEFYKERINQIKNLYERELYRGFNKGDVFELTNPNTGVITRYKVLGLDVQQVKAKIVNEELYRDYPTKKAIDKLFEDWPFHLINNPNIRLAEFIPYKEDYIRPTIRVEAVSNNDPATKNKPYVTTLFVSDSLLERAKRGLVSLGESDFKFAPKLIEDDPRFDDLTKPVEAIEGEYYGREDDVGEIEETKTDAVRERDRSTIAESEKLKASVDEIIEKNPNDSLQRIVDEAVTRPVLEERATEGNPVPFEMQSKTYSLGDKIIYHVADKFIGLKNIEEQINIARKNQGLPPIESLSSAYQGEERIAGMVANEVRAFTEDFQKPLAEKIGNATDKSGIDVDEVDEFLILRHAIERNKRIYQKDKEQDPNQNPGSGSLPSGEVLTDEFVKQRMRDRYGMTWNDNRGEWSGGNERAKTLNDIASDVDNIVNTTIDRQVQGDLLSRNDAKIIKNIFKYYAPLRGKETEDDIASVMIGGGGLGVKGSDIMTAKGRRSAAETPLGHVMLNAQKAISRSVKNKEFGHSLKRLIEENPDDNFWRVISPDSPKYSKEFDTSYTYVGSDPAMQGQRVSSLEGRNDPSNWVKQLVLRRNSGIAQDKDLLVTKVDGKPVYIEIDDPRLRAAFLSLDGSTLQDWVNKFSVINRWLSMVNTSLNPEFVLGNFARDVQTAIGNLMAEQDMPGGKAFEKQLIGKVIKGIPSAMNAFYKGYRRYDLKDGTLRGDLTGITAKDKANVSEYLGAGAKADWFHSRPPEEQKATIKSMIEMSRGTFKGNFQKRFQQTMDFVEDANATVENAVRLSTFIEAREAFLDAGMGRREAIAKAASLAKNLTINFNRKGMAGDVINATYLFFNASVQGTMNFARGFKFWNKDHYSPYKTGAAGGLIAFGALLSMIADEESEELEDGRPAYDSIPDYVKERNIVIMADEPDEGTSNIFVDEEGNEYRGKQNYYTIPLPYGYNVFFNIGQSMYDVTSDKKSVPEAGSYLTSALIGSFFPVGTATSDNAAVSFVKTISPTFTDPFVDLAVNENFWGSPIIKEDLPFATETARSAKAMASTRKEIVDATQWLNSLLGGDRYEGAMGGWGDISPDALQYLMNYALGAAGTTAVRSYTAIENWAKDEDLKSQDIPFIRRIKGETTTMNTQSRFYDRKQKIQQNLKRLDPLRDEERIKFRKKIQPYITMSFKLKSIEKDLKILAEGVDKARQDAYENPDKAFEYAKKEQDLYEQRGRLYSQFNRQYDKIVGKD
jgi:hypothetical protein